LRFFSYLFYPVIFIFSRVARFVTRLAGGKSSQQTMFITREELRVLLDISDTPSHLDRQRIRRIMRFGDTTVGEAMIPLPEVVGFNESRGLAEAVRTVWQYGFNRLPVYRGNITNVKSVLTLTSWDLMDPSISDRTISDFIQPPLYISPSQTLDRVLPRLQARNDHLGIVVDEFGAAIGILTMEDVLEEVVGEIDVGYDFDEYQPKRRLYFEQESEDVYLMGGRTPVSEVNDLLHLNLTVGEAHTIGGLIGRRLRRIPEVGDRITEQSYRITVVEADERSVTKVRLEHL
jgi:CBS domain containing-hemolysin-like protein